MDIQTIHFTAHFPSTWPPSDDASHTGDWWYQPPSGELRQYEGSLDEWQLLSDPAKRALSHTAFQLSAGEPSLRLLLDEPVPPYSRSDLWLNEGTFFQCIQARDAGPSFAETDWLMTNPWTT